MIDRNLATEMMAAILESNDMLVQAIHDVKVGGDEQLAKQIQHRLEGVLSIHLINIMNPIGKEYPELYPEALRPKPRDPKA